MIPIRKNIGQQDLLEINFDNKGYNQRKNFMIVYVMFAQMYAQEGIIYGIVFLVFGENHDIRY